MRRRIPAPPAATDNATANVLFTTDVPARVVRVAAFHGHVGLRSSTGSVDELVCERTPCWAALPYGDHELRFEASEDRERGDSTVLTVGGIGILAAVPTLEQPGATREWVPPSTGTAASLTLGGKF